jgi:hypothetical protein
MTMMIEVKFEDSNKIFELAINESLPFIDQHKAFLENVEYESQEFRMLHHLYDAKTHLFILDTNQLKTCKSFKEY